MESKRNLKKIDILAIIILFISILVILINNFDLLTEIKKGYISFDYLILIIVIFATIGYLIFRLIIKIKYKLSYGYKKLDIKYVRDN